ncbi:hypothetical protein [Aliiruegeria lutimaris]|uniref:hypothetical protein n=1 Tax=Aliiruegeria lutimaris TaxID=571298 RepID=UPI00147B122A|nr:hypothetical protein [Aliiruegeria lutimaris]
MGHALGDGIDDLIDLALDLGEVALRLDPFLPDLLRESVVFRLILGDEGGDQIGMQKPILEAAQDRFLQLVPPDGQLVVAGSLVPGVG